MKPNSTSDGFVRRVRLSVAWYTLREYVNGALWVLPGVAGLAALAVGFAMSQVTVAPGSALNRLAFQGTADDARALLITISSTVVTVIALVLGLTVVALQLSSTQSSAGSWQPSSTARQVYLPSAWRPVSELRTTRGSRSVAPSCCFLSVWEWWS